MRINPDNKKIRYSGRIDWANPKEPIWVHTLTLNLNPITT